MGQFYFDPARESDAHALPDAEAFYVKPGEKACEWVDQGPGWYWWPCFPGCLPDGDPTGPFKTEAEAIADARESASEDA